MIANIIEILLGLAGNILGLFVAFDNPGFSGIGRGLSIVSFIIRTLALF